MIEILRDVTYGNCSNHGSIVCIGSFGVYIINSRASRLHMMSFSCSSWGQMIDMLHEFMYQNSRNDDSMASIGSCRMYTINSRASRLHFMSFEHSP